MKIRCLRFWRLYLSQVFLRGIWAFGGSNNWKILRHGYQKSGFQEKARLLPSAAREI